MLLPHNYMCWSSLALTIWKAEVYACIARYYEMKDQADLSRKYYSAAKKEYEMAGAINKSLVCAYNLKMVDHRSKVTTTYFKDQEEFSKLFLTLENYSMTGLVLTNLANQYRKMGLFQSAAGQFQKAKTYFFKHGESNYDYQLCNAYLALSYLHLGETEKFQECLIQVSKSRYPQLIAISKHLRHLSSPQRLNSYPQDVDFSPSWRAIWSEFENGSNGPKESLSHLHENLILSLIQSPKSVHDLARSIYKGNENSDDKVQKVKRLLSRLRQSSKPWVELKSGLYCINEQRI